MLDGTQTTIEQLKKAFSDDAAPDEYDFASLIETFVVRRDLAIEAQELISELKELFSNGKCPTGSDFAKLIDSFIPKTSTDFISFEDLLPHVANLHEALEGINDRKLISALRLAQVLDQKKNYVSTHSIKNSAVTSEKILDQSITSTKLSTVDLILPEQTRAKTQILSDDSEAIATTAFVQNAIRNLNDFQELITLDKSNGYPITNVGSETHCYIGNNQMIYSNRDDNYKMYLKSATAMENGKIITSINTICPCYVGNDQIIYTNSSDGYKLYLKSATGTEIGKAITSETGYYTCYIGNGQIVYTKNFKLYLKSILDTDNGKPITNQSSVSHCYIGNNQILYLDQNLSLYLKSATELDNGKKICDFLPIGFQNYYVFPFCYVGNNQIVYTNADDGNLYIKSATGSDLGSVITNTIGFHPCYIGNGKIVYSNFEDKWCLYVKNLFVDPMAKKVEEPEMINKKKLSPQEIQKLLQPLSSRFPQLPKPSFWNQLKN